MTRTEVITILAILVGCTNQRAAAGRVLHTLASQHVIL